MTFPQRLRQQILGGLVAALALSGLVTTAEGLTITRTGTDVDGRKAWVRFEQASAGANLVVTLANISPNDIDGSVSGVNADQYILTGLFFNLVGNLLNPSLGKVSALVADQVNSSGTQITTDSFGFCPGGTCVFPSPNNTGGNIGGEWGYLFNSTSAGIGKAGTANMISTDGYGIGGWTTAVRFTTAAELSGGASPVDIDYGMTSFGDLTTTNTDLGNGNEFMKNALTFTFTVPAGYTLATVQDVRFQYGSVQDDPFIDVSLPESLLLLGSGLMGLVWRVRRRRTHQPEA